MMEVNKVKALNNNDYAKIEYKETRYDETKELPIMKINQENLLNALARNNSINKYRKAMLLQIILKSPSDYLTDIAIFKAKSKNTYEGYYLKKVHPLCVQIN